MQRIVCIAILALVLSILSACTSTQSRSKEQVQASAEAYTNLGLGYLKQGNRKLALDNLEKAIKIDPEFTAAQHSLALAYQQFGRPELADKHYRLALELDGKNGLIQNNYGAFLCRQKKIDDAEKHFLMALEDIKYETPARALENAGLCTLGKPGKGDAEMYFRRALQIDPKLPVTLLQMAKISMLNKKYLNVRAYIQRYAEVAKHTSQSLWIAIQAERELKDNLAEIKYTSQLQEKFPDSKEAIMLLKPNKQGTDS